MADGGAAGPTSRRPRLDVDTWTVQLEELLALQSVYEDDISILAAPGAGAAGDGPSCSDGSGASSAPAGPLSAEELLAAGPPPELLLPPDEAEGADSEGGGSSSSCGCFVVEALVHVDMPEGGLQLLIEMPPMRLQQLQPQPPQQLAPVAAPVTATGTAANAGSSATVIAAAAGAAVANGGGMSGAGKGANGAAGGGGGGRGRGRGDASANGTSPDKGGGRGQQGRGSSRGSGRGSGRLRSGDAHATSSQTPSPPSKHQPAVMPAPATYEEQPAAVSGVKAAVQAAAPVLVVAESSPPVAAPAVAVPAAVPAHPAAEAEGEGVVEAVVTGQQAAGQERHEAPLLMPFGGTLHFLSPIRLTLTLPPTYPAVHPPELDVQALWLSEAQAAQLRAALRAQWAAAGPGTPISFTLVDWLRGEALAELGLTGGSGGGGGGGGSGGKLVLRRGQQQQQQQQPAVTGAAGAAAGGAKGGGGGGGQSLEALAMALVRYSARREQHVFDESLVSCPICLDQQLGSRCVRLPECRHAFCVACVATHLRTQLGAGAVDNMRCPDPACRRQLPHGALQQLLSAAEYDRWEALTLQRTLDKMEDLVYCPRCREPCLEDRDHCTLCPSCFYSFCSLCEEAWHPGSRCLDADAKLALLEARRAGRGEAAARESATERARREVNKMNELKSLALVQSSTKQCPCCSMAVEKTEGCNKMTCAYCGVYWCWRCCRMIKGYDHFKEDGCELFDQVEIDRWNARWNGGLFEAPRRNEVEDNLAALQVARRVGQGRWCHCVVCGQQNLKEGRNNNIRCWSCNSHFCYLCRTWLRNRPGAHFGTGAGRCKQHTDD
ncbi:hypothetical protein CHLRE_01g018900v5 [Chlamydomonas reinhardtii]|uniref:RING-type domain-containing protein n=1 Tax=Chlamydomonas reinhardtii TaxID=3055 RepID=A0A2K3E5Y4_CHLRE|nr:uncharacterized protein CHLRE_01g018900v5 [Chlamydomonas reinhardtii]PNW88202.1 hypothetical protein CHLRE_01g018900v5 [Chlamydomonas reinhardtii]